MESKRCELVLNAVFYWEPVEFFQKRYDMITLQFFQDEPCSIVLDLFACAQFVRWLFCESSIAVVQSWCDHSRNELFCGTVREEWMDRGNSSECKKRSAAEVTDVLFHWQCLVKMHSKVRNGGLKRNATIFFCRVNFLCWLLFRYLFHPSVTTVAHKRPRSFRQKCRWQVTAKHMRAQWVCSKAENSAI